MVQFNLKKRETSFKVVYYGPALSGKTTNLQTLFGQADSMFRGRLVTLETRDDRTIYFDMLPVFVSARGGQRLSFKLYTVPGQPVHNSTRRVVLRSVDAVAFIASGERDQMDANIESWTNLRENLKSNNLQIEDVPIIIQFNKMDLSDVLTQREIEAVQEFSGVPTFGAAALEGKGTFETLQGLLLALWDKLMTSYSIEDRLGLTRDEFASHVSDVFGPGKKRGRIPT